VYDTITITGELDLCKSTKISLKSCVCIML